MSYSRNRKIDLIKHCRGVRLTHVQRFGEDALLFTWGWTQSAVAAEFSGHGSTLDLAVCLAHGEAHLSFCGCLDRRQL